MKKNDEISIKHITTLVKEHLKQDFTCHRFLSGEYETAINMLFPDRFNIVKSEDAQFSNQTNDLGWHAIGDIDTIIALLHKVKEKASEEFLVDKATKKLREVAGKD